MRRLTIFTLSCLLANSANSQQLSVKDFLSAASLSSKKFENFISKKNFIPFGKDWRNDTIVNMYSLKKKKMDSLSVTRVVETYQLGNDFSFSFQTSSHNDYVIAKRELKETGFTCPSGIDSLALSPVLYQRKNTSVWVSSSITDIDTVYSFLFHEEQLPSLTSIHYADDLLQFTSHECLVSVFGEKNVRKDLYYFSENEISKCSVLFPRTKKQAVFIWKDEVNMRQLSYVLIGGNMPTGDLKDYKDVIAENSWISKDGIYSGMSLSNLTRLNGNDFKFYGKNSEFPFMVVPENTGKINFKKNVVVLGCLSSTGSELLNSDVIFSTDVLKENPGIYVFMFMLSPSKN